MPKAYHRFFLTDLNEFLSSQVKCSESCSVLFTLCDPIDYIVHGLLQARILECVALPFSRESSQPRSPALQADSLTAEPQGKPQRFLWPVI